MNTTTKLDFNKKVSINFSGGEITGNGGLLALAEFNNKLQIEKLLAKYLPETRNGNFEHTKDKIIYQKIMRIIAGYSSNNNYEYLKNDPVFQEIHKGRIASSPTCSRLENTFNYSDEGLLRKVGKDIESYNLSESKISEVIVDLDTTNDPCSENLEGGNFIPHYGLNGYAPLLAFNGLNGDVIAGILKPGKYHCSTFSYSFTKNIINFYKKEGVKNITIRGDSAFPNETMMWLCEKEQVYYTFKLKSYKNMILKIESFAVRGRSVFVELEHQAQKWSHSRRVVACIDWKARETEESKKERKKNPKKKKVKQMGLFPIYSFVVTNNQLLASEEVFSMYNGRATIEKSIEEAKNGFGIDHLSNSKFKVNATNFQIYLLAIQLLQLFRKFTLARESRSSKKSKNQKQQDSKRETRKFKKLKVGRKVIALPSVDTVRKQLFSIPAKIIKTGRKIIYKCSSSFGFQDKFREVLEKIQQLPQLQIV